MPGVPSELDGLCPYCEKMASSPARSVYPFCSSLHRSSHTAGHAKHAVLRHLAASAREGDAIEVDGLVHRVHTARAWKHRNREHNYASYKSEWRTACGEVFPDLYPPKTDGPVTCFLCVTGKEDDKPNSVSDDDGYFTLKTQSGRWPLKENSQRASQTYRRPPRRSRHS